MYGYIYLPRFSASATYVLAETPMRASSASSNKHKMVATPDCLIRIRSSLKSREMMAFVGSFVSG